MSNKIRCMKGFRSLAIAFIFLFDIRLGRINLLPDFIAYFMFIQGLFHLQVENKSYEGSYKIATFLLVYSVIHESIWILQLGDFMLGLLIIVEIVGSVMKLIMLHGIMKGTEEFAHKREDKSLAERSKETWYLYLVEIVGYIIILIFFKWMNVYLVYLYMYHAIVIVVCIRLMNDAYKIEIKDCL